LEIMKKNIIFSILFIVVAGCAKTIKESRVENPAILRATKCIAVLPLENLSGKVMAGYKMAEIVSSEIITSKRFGVMEPIEVLKTLAAAKIPLTARIDSMKAQEIGMALGVDAVISGTLREFSFHGPFAELGEGAPVVSFELQLVDSSNGTTAWSGKVESIGKEAIDTSRNYLINHARNAVNEGISPLFESVNPRNIYIPCWRKPPPAVAATPSAPAQSTQQRPAAPPTSLKPTPVTAPAPQKTGPAKIELINASGKPTVVDIVGMTLLSNNHDLRKITDQKTPANTTAIYYKPGYDTEAQKIAGEIKKGLNIIRKDNLPNDVDIQIIAGKDF